MKENPIRRLILKVVNNLHGLHTQYLEWALANNNTCCTSALIYNNFEFLTFYEYSTNDTVVTNSFVRHQL